MGSSYMGFSKATTVRSCCAYIVRNVYIILSQVSEIICFGLTFEVGLLDLRRRSATTTIMTIMIAAPPPAAPAIIPRPPPPPLAEAAAPAACVVEVVVTVVVVTVVEVVVIVVVVGSVADDDVQSMAEEKVWASSCAMAAYDVSRHEPLGYVGSGPH